MNKYFCKKNLIYLTFEDRQKHHCFNGRKKGHRKGLICGSLQIIRT